MTTKNTIFSENMVVYYMAVSITTGKMNLIPTDLHLPGDIDASGIVKLGSKQIFRKESLKVFATIKRRITDYLTARGVRYQGGIAIPRPNNGEVRDFLELNKEEFYRAKDLLLSQYDTLKEQFFKDVKDSMPDMLEHIIPYVMTKDYLNTQIQFAYWTDIEEEGSFGERVIDNVADQARESLKILKDSKVYNAKSLEHLTKIRDKLQGMSFATPYASTIVNHIDGFVNKLPKTGRLSQEVVHDLMKELSFLSDPSNWDALKASVKVEDKPETGEVIKPFNFSTLNIDDFHPASKVADEKFNLENFHPTTLSNLVPTTRYSDF
ncbi:DUF3150 domain-containing protein [Moritella sp. F3]|uniref:DUF3150 domain-containing protein n=1 Tax=Moritella sp. F3 TaxID=2718882 RepID=UPI0018E0FE95|nr:DUF3150 domain-containing protein [Moritella sp. F3]GIC77610.1 hypothetical protein FMO001_23370 [Moritella sp. F1]GIC82023.1 hypothetical protein FMO003_23040 [Moritella sp. F3]